MKKFTLCVAWGIVALGEVLGAPGKPAGATQHAGRQNARPMQRYVPGAYIVELNGESAVAAAQKSGMLASRAARFAPHRLRIAQEQAALRPRLEARGVKIHRSVDVVMNAFMVQYAGARQDLEAIAGVKHVYPVRRLARDLDRAVGLTQVSDVWRTIGGAANAGAGVKIGILDTGIDIVHPGFSDAGFTAPTGYPLADTTDDLAYTNNKVIVARSYADMVSMAVDGNGDDDPTAQDHSGHGTAVAMVAAGVTNTGYFGTITGVAPGAYLGIYRVFNTLDTTTTDAADIAAVNDAVADQMDVINLSFGTIYAPRFDQDPLVAAVEAAYQAGTIVITSAGNDGTPCAVAQATPCPGSSPAFTSIKSPAIAPHAIAVAASTNDRAFGPGVWAPYLGTFGGWDVFNGGWVYNSAGGPAPGTPLTAPAIDAATVNNPLGCSKFDSRVAGRVVIMGTGSCSSASKVANAQAAGAVAALVSDTQSDTDAGNSLTLTLGPTSLPAQSIDFYSAQYLTSQLAITPLSLTMGFNLCGDPTYNTPCGFSVTPNLLTGFSSAGPGVDLSIKPEIVAPGENLSMATQSFDDYGDLYDPNGYVVSDGTSYASSFIAGVAALIKAARPGLTPDQYRSLIINSGNGMADPNGNAYNINQIGGGLVNALNAYQSPVTATPVTLGLGTSSGSPQISQTITLTNVGTGNDVFGLSVTSLGGTLQPVLGTQTVPLGAGKSQDVNVQFNASGLAAGAYQGYVVATSAATGAQIQIPYWLDVPTAAPANYLLLGLQFQSLRNRPLLDAFDFRLTDAAGAPITNITPSVTVVSGGGSVSAVNLADDPNANVAIDSSGTILQDIPGLWTVDVVLGPQSVDNVFRVTAGSLSFIVTVTGCRSFDSFGQCVS